MPHWFCLPASATGVLPALFCDEASPPRLGTARLQLQFVSKLALQFNSCARAAAKNFDAGILPG
jgi:hypothetical protein